MNKFLDIISNLANGNFYVIFLICILLVVLITTFYVLAMEVKISKKIDKLAKVCIDGNDEVKSDAIKLEEKEEVYNKIENVEPVVDKVENVIENNIPEENSNDQLELSRESYIGEYEREQEEIAIISTEELEEKLDELKSRASNGDIHMDIQKYEEEQEQKAIISYDELRERASENVLNVTDAETEGIKVSNIDVYNINEEPKKRNPYGYEEDFLKALKDFRASL